MPSSIAVTIASPQGNVPSVPRLITVSGRLSITPLSGHSIISQRVMVQFGAGGPSRAATFKGLNWDCISEPNPAVPPGSVITITATASATLRFFHNPSEPDIENIAASTSIAVRLPAPVPPNLTIDSFTQPILAADLPLAFTLSGTAVGVQSPVQVVQYQVENGQFANAFNVTGNWSQWRVALPVPPGDHVIVVRAVDGFGTTAVASTPLAVRPQVPIIVPPDTRTTLSGVPTTASITSWTRLEPQVAGADMGTSSGARVFDPLWLLTRQWQMGEFQGEDAGTPVQARVRAACATLARCRLGQPATPAPAARYDPAKTPLDVLIARRRMRPANANDARMLTFAVESGLHFLRMLDEQPLSRSYRVEISATLAMAPLDPGSAASVDERTARFVQTMQGRAPDGRRLADRLRSDGPAAFAGDPALQIAPGDRAEVQQTAAAWLAWYDGLCSEPPEGGADGGAEAGNDAWIPSRLEYAVSVGTRLSSDVNDDLTFVAAELDGASLDWSNFDLDPQARLSMEGDRTFSTIVETTVPAPVSVPGMPAPRFWEMEDARIAYGLVPVGPTDLAHLLAIEYASTYGNDWFLVPLTVPIGSVTRVDSLVVTDTFGVRSLLRPIGDPALSAPFFSMWQTSFVRLSTPSAPAPVLATNRFFLPPTLGRMLDGAALEDVLFLRDEMANVAWAIERAVESPTERPAQRDETDDSQEPAGMAAGPNANLPRYRLSSFVPSNWVPLLPVQLKGPTGETISRLRRGAVLQPDGSQQVHRALGDVLNAEPTLLLFDEEVPREGVHVTRRRRLARWVDGSTWLWTSFHHGAGQGEGSSGLRFDQVEEPAARGQ